MSCAFPILVRHCLELVPQLFLLELADGIFQMDQPRLQYPCFDEEWSQYPEFLHHLVCDLSMKFCIAVKNDGRELNSMVNFYRVPHNLIAIHSREEQTGSELFCSLIPSVATLCG